MSRSIIFIMPYLSASYSRIAQRVESSLWILTYGVWNDNGVWNDSEIWKDAA